MKVGKKKLSNSKTNVLIIYYFTKCVKLQKNTINPILIICVIILVYDLMINHHF